MTFGKIKSLIEKNLLESYINEKDFKQTLREFKHNILNNKSISKAYSIYDQLSTPQGLTESDAKDFLEEGVSLLQTILSNIKLPKTISESIKNKYDDIDTLVYQQKLNLSERVQSRKNIISVLTAKPNTIKESINIPIKSMVSVANQTLRNYIETLDEDSKKEFIQLVSEDTKTLQDKFEVIRESAITKLSTLLEKENETEVKSTIIQTINKLKDEKFDQMNFLKLKNLEKSI